MPRWRASCLKSRTGFSISPKSEQWTRKDMRAAVRDVHREAKRIARKWPAGQYGLICCDPPWQPFDGALDPTRQIENQYPTMTVDELVAMADQSPSGEPGGVKAITAPDCVLAMWTTAQKLAESCQVIDAWGFMLKTGAVWVKDSIGMGYWFRQRHDLERRHYTALSPSGPGCAPSCPSSARRALCIHPITVYASAYV